MKTFLIYVDHGLMLGYYLYTGLAHKLTEKGVRLVFLVQDELLDRLRSENAGNENLVFESSREAETLKYQKEYKPVMQQMFEYVRGASMSPRIPLTYVDTHRQRKEYGATGRWKAALISMRPLIFLLRYSKIARKAFRRLQNRLLTPNIFSDLFNRYQPDMVISSTAGWRTGDYIVSLVKTL